MLSFVLRKWEVTLIDMDSDVMNLGPCCTFQYTLVCCDVIMLDGLQMGVQN